MAGSPNTRREFLQTTSAAVTSAAMTSLAMADTKPAERPKILNHNPRMGYRRLGKTGFMISEISLGGHGGATAEDRIPVLEKAIELGINYVEQQYRRRVQHVRRGHGPGVRMPNARSGLSASPPGRKR